MYRRESTKQFKKKKKDFSSAMQKNTILREMRSKEKFNLKYDCELI